MTIHIKQRTDFERFLAIAGPLVKVLFITHEATRTGAPLVLLTLLKFLRSQEGFDFEVLVEDTAGACGELLPEFAKLALVHKLDQILSRKESLAVRALRKLGRSADTRERMKLWLQARSYDLVYANSAVCCRSLPIWAGLNCPVVVHVHELEVILRVLGSALLELKDRADFFIGASEGVKQNLVDNHGVPANRIAAINEFIPVGGNTDDKTDENFRDVLGIPRTAQIVGNCGAISHRKGVDLFINLARRLSRNTLDHEFHFVWVGGFARSIADEIYSQFARNDVELLGLRDRFHFVGAVENPLDYIRIFDVAALTSREDPFPLVMLEYALLQKPIVCFDKSGGAPDFVENDCGVIVPYLDTDQMAAAVHDLLKDPDLRARMGERGRQKVLAACSADQNSAKIVQLLRETVKAGRG